MEKLNFIGGLPWWVITLMVVILGFSRTLHVKEFRIEVSSQVPMAYGHLAVPLQTRMRVGSVMWFYFYHLINAVISCE